MMNRNLVISVEFPALDRLLNFLESGQQTEIDALTVKLGTAAKKLAKAKDDIFKAVLDETKP